MKLKEDSGNAKERERESTPVIFALPKVALGDDILSLMEGEVFVFHLEVLYFW